MWLQSSNECLLQLSLANESSSDWLKRSLLQDEWEMGDQKERLVHSHAAEDQFLYWAVGEDEHHQSWVTWHTLSALCLEWYNNKDGCVERHDIGLDSTLDM